MERKWLQPSGSVKDPGRRDWDDVRYIAGYESNLISCCSNHKALLTEKYEAADLLHHLSHQNGITRQLRTCPRHAEFADRRSGGCWMSWWRRAAQGLEPLISFFH
jgi:hypothetical protein